MKALLILAALSTLALSSCSTMQKLGAALSTPEARQIEMGLTDLGLTAAVVTGKLTPGTALLIRDGVAVVTSGGTTLSKVQTLSDLGLTAAVNKGLLNPGDAVLIKDTTAIITQAIIPPTAESVPVTSGK